MSYTDPQSLHNPTTGTSPPASWGDVLRDDLEWLARNAPNCGAYNSVAISVANNTVQALTLNTDRWDVGGMHSTVSNTSRLTVPTGGDGTFLFGGNIEYASNATGDRRIYLRLNGSTVVAYQIVTAAGGGGLTTVAITRLYPMVAGDYLEMCAFQNSGGALNVNNSPNASPELWAKWMCL